MDPLSLLKQARSSDNAQIEQCLRYASNASLVFLPFMSLNDKLQSKSVNMYPGLRELEWQLREVYVPIAAEDQHYVLQHFTAFILETVQCNPFSSHRAIQEASKQLEEMGVLPVRKQNQISLINRIDDLSSFQAFTLTDFSLRLGNLDELTNESWFCFQYAFKLHPDTLAKSSFASLVIQLLEDYLRCMQKDQTKAGSIQHAEKFIEKTMKQLRIDLGSEYEVSIPYDMIDVKECLVFLLTSTSRYELHDINYYAHSIIHQHIFMILHPYLRQAFVSSLHPITISALASRFKRVRPVYAKVLATELLSISNNLECSNFRNNTYQSILRFEFHVKLIKTVVKDDTMVQILYDQINEIIKKRPLKSEKDFMVNALLQRMKNQICSKCT